MVYDLNQHKLMESKKNIIDGYVFFLNISGSLWVLTGFINLRGDKETALFSEEA